MSDFEPTWWCRGPHAQTIWGAVLRATPKIAVHRECWETPDEDFIEVDHVHAEVGRPVLIVLHGLEGCSETKPVRGFLCAAQQRGWRALGVNFRSCGRQPNRLRRSYHAGETSDLQWIIKRVTTRDPEAPICCVGMSLGGNVLLKYLGEQQDHAPAAFKAAVAISTPFDLAVSGCAFERGFFNRFYMKRLVCSLKRKTLEKLAQYPDLVDRQRLVSVRTICEFDDLVTAPVHGFANAANYWALSSCRRFLPSIRRPTLLINALDDPIVPVETLPQGEIAQNRFLSAAFPEAGGHMGFVGGTQPWRPILWAEEKALEFLNQQLMHVPAQTSSRELVPPH